jgi:putative membrane protein
MKLLRRRVLAGLAAAGVAILMAPTMVGATSVGTVAVQQDMSGDPDHQFLMAAAQGAITNILMGKLASDMATTEQVRQFGQKMMVDNTRALAESSSLLLEAGIEPPTTPVLGTKEMLHELASHAGTDFDAVFMRQAVMDYRGDVTEFGMATTERGAAAAEFASRWLPTFEQELFSAENIATGLGLSLDGI